MERVSNALPRRLFIASVVFGLFVLFDIALFGWLIFRSLSQREIERVLLETRAEAETLARQLARRTEEQGRDLYTAMAVERETQAYIDSNLREREIVRDVKILDKDGMLVFEMHSKLTPPLVQGSSQTPPAGSPELQLGEIDVPVEIKEKEFATVYQVPDIQVPIGQFGTLQIGISPVELSQRIEVLRQDLVRQAAWIGVFSIVLLLTAYGAVWLLVQRSRRLELQALEAERMAYIGTLASGLAHEIRNPLNSLNLNMQMLEEEMEERGSAVSPVSPASGKRLLAITRSEISRLERLVSDFLAYAKPRPLEMEEMPAVRPLERVRDLLAGEIQKRGARVEVEDHSGGARVRVDPEQIGQLLLNLARNAMDAAEESGRKPVLELSVSRHGPSVALSVRDNGVGIPPEERERVFELFYSTRKGGTGLGLAIVDRIARAHGGRVKLESAVGEGTVVTVELPVVASPEPSPRTVVETPA
ncbi:MAG: two-component system, NtrC family, sensor histidine kinase HydH [Acidobacteriota bacterium]|jgi:signal transduction histidine kinase|nr:two-component system, NtrC family, sensor histidine kinase HydH [Acidobacteriota bacterium]